MSGSKGDLPPEEPSSIFSTLTGQFPTSQSDEKIQTGEFLEASVGVVTIVEKFGKVFAPVIYDMNGNIRKLTGKYEEDKETYKYIEDMILQQRNERQIVDALQWLRRGLHFVSRFFQAIIDDSDNIQDLSPFIKSAYKESLERYHGWVGSQLFHILSRFIPNRQQLLYQLALKRPNQDKNVLDEMRVFTLGMSTCVQRLAEFYQEHDLETNDRV